MNVGRNKLNSERELPQCSVIIRRRIQNNDLIKSVSYVLVQCGISQDIFYYHGKICFRFNARQFERKVQNIKNAFTL